MPFINGIWVEPEEPKPNSIKITSSMLSLSHIQSVDSRGEWIVSMGIILFSHKYDFNKPEYARKIDRVSLKKSLYNYLDDYSKKYFEIESFSARVVRYKFLWKKWLNDALNNIKPKSNISKFQKEFDLKAKLPNLISNNYSVYFGDFIIRKFKQIVSDKKFNNWFNAFVIKNVDVQNMFDFEYVFQTNKIIATLKSMYVLGMIYATGKIVSNKKEPFIKINFEEKTKKKANNFNRNEWEKFIKKKFF